MQSLLGRLGGLVLRFPVPAGTPEGDRSVKDAVAAGLAALIAEHRQAIAAFGTDTRDGTLDRAADRVRAHPPPPDAPDPLALAEQLRQSLADAHASAAKLVAALKGKRKEQKALSQVYASLKSLHLTPDREGP